MTESQTESVRMLWYEDLDYPLVTHDAPEIERRLGISPAFLNEPDEWVLGYRFIGPRDAEDATVLYLTRRFNAEGVRFNMRTEAASPPDTTDLHELVKRYIRDYIPVRDEQHEGTGEADRNRRWHSAWSLVLDRQAQLANLHKGDLALARGHLSDRLRIEIPPLAAAGFDGNAEIEFTFDIGHDTVDVTIGLGIGGEFGQLRARANSGDNTSSARFSTLGIAKISNLKIDRYADLLHLTFELRD